MFASTVTPAPPWPSSSLLNFTVPMETPAGSAISALSSPFSADASRDSRLVEAPFIPVQAPATVQRQATAISFSFPFIGNTALCSFPSGSRFPGMPLDPLVFDDTGRIDQRQMGEALGEVADLSGRGGVVLFCKEA